MKRLVENISLYSFILMASLGGCLISTLLLNGEQAMMHVMDWMFIRFLIIGSLSGFVISKIILMLIKVSDKQHSRASQDILDDLETIYDK